MIRLKELREIKQLSQQRLAIEMNISQTMISKYELGQAEPDIQMIGKLSRFFRVSSDYLLGLSSEPFPPLGTALSMEERQLLFHFRRLSTHQQQLLLAYLRGLLQE